MPPKSQSKQKTTSGAGASPSEIAVILAGFGYGDLAKQCGEECARRGMKIQGCGLGKGTGEEVVAGNKVAITDFSDPQAKNKLVEAVDHAKKSNLIPVVVDVTQVVNNANIYNEVGVPFVMNVVGAENEEKVEGMINKTDNLALVDTEMNKEIAAFNKFFEDWSVAYPGIFSGFSLLGNESQPKAMGDALHAATRSHLTSFGRLFDEDFPESVIQRIRDADESERAGVPHEALMSHYQSNYKLKNGSGSVSFEFKQSVSGTQGYASGVADSVQYLADNVKAAVKSKMFSIEDLLRGPGGGTETMALEGGTQRTGAEQAVPETSSSSSATTTPTKG